MNSMELPDIQKTKDTRGIAINNAGICNFKIPVSIKMKNGSDCSTIATVCATISVNSQVKGINMSRLPIFIQSNQDLTLNLIGSYADQIIDICDTNRCKLIYEFPYFITKQAPVSKLDGIVNYNCKFIVISEKQDDSTFIHKNFITITALASTCCPCSKEISDYNAHNQKCYIKLETLLNNNDKILWLEDLFKIAEESASCEIFSVLKRPDEKFVTEAMYDHPQFVEDVVRDAYLKLSTNKLIKSFKISAYADESIHMHTACASVKTSDWHYDN